MVYVYSLGHTFVFAVNQMVRDVATTAGKVNYLGTIKNRPLASSTCTRAYMGPWYRLKK